MKANAFLGFAVVAFALVGLALGIGRVAPGSDSLTIGIAVAAAVLGAAVFAAVAEAGRRGLGTNRAKWLLVLALVAMLFLDVDRLSERWQLALLSLALGYVLGFVSTVARRLAGPS